jgi:hypothetical protein
LRSDGTDTLYALSSRIILSIAKLFGRGVHDEKLSRGLCVELIKDLEAGSRHFKSKKAF